MENKKMKGVSPDELRKASLITAIKTPYLPDGSFDLESYDNLIERQIRYGVDGVVVGGTTGEGHLMNWDEHIMLIAHTVHYFGDRIKVIGNIGSNNTGEAVHAGHQGFAVGMHAGLIINPYYGKTSHRGIVLHLQRTLELGPCIVYNVPSRTGVDIPPKIIRELAKNPNFVGVKECGGFERICDYEKEGIPCWSGNDDDSMHSRHEGSSHGVISVTSNLVPDLMRRLMDKPEETLNEQMKDLFQWLFQEPNPIPLNTVLAMAGLVRPAFRLPYVPLSEDEQKKMLLILDKLSSESLKLSIRTIPEDEFSLC